MLEMQEIGREGISREEHLYDAKSGIVFYNTMQSKTVAVVFGLMGENERDTSPCSQKKRCPSAMPMA